MIISKWIEEFKRLRLRFYMYRRDKKLAKGLPPIPADEMKKFRNTWTFAKISNFDMIYPRIYNKIYGYYPYAFITDYHLQLILEKTNRVDDCQALSNKALFDVYFDKMPFPRNYVRAISGVYYDTNMGVLSEEEALNTSLNINEGTFIIKPSIISGCGREVRKINIKDIDHATLREIYKIYDGEFVVQECLRQCVEIERLNPTSINSCRITSIYIDGKFGCSTVIKIGKTGAIVDNWKDSYLVGVDSQGNLCEFGFDINLNRVFQTDNGIPFKGVSIPCYDKMIEFVETAHKQYLPQCGIVGWDVVIDSNYEIKVIEMNLVQPGVVGEQLASGTFFEDFVDVINKRLS